MQKPYFFLALVCAAVLGCGSGSAPSESQQHPGPPPPPPPPPPVRCDADPVVDFPVLASGDLLVVGHIRSRGDAEPFGPAVVRSDTLETIDLIARDACGRRTGGRRLDPGLGALVLVMGPSEEAPASDHGLLLEYRLPSTLPRRAEFLREPPMGYTPHPTYEPSMLVHATRERCAVESHKTVVSVLDSGTIVIELPLWESECTTDVRLDHIAMSPDRRTAVWAYRHLIDGAWRSRVYAVDLDPVSEVRVVAEMAENLGILDMAFGADGHVLMTAQRLAPPGSGGVPGNVFPPIDGFWRAALAGGDTPVRLNPPPDEGFGITRFYDGAGRYLRGDGSGAVWFEGDWDVNAWWVPPADHDRTTSPLWTAAAAQPGVRVRMNDPDHVYIHAFETERHGGGAAWLASRDDHQGDCTLAVEDAVLETGLSCGDSHSTHPLQFVHRAGESAAVGIAFRQGLEWSYRDLTPGAPVFPLGPGGLLRDPVVHPDGQLYYVLNMIVRRIDRATGDIEELDVGVDFISTLHVIP